MDPAVKELAELVGRVLAERWLEKQGRLPAKESKSGKAKRG